jgi:hypothetical protein
MRETHAYWIKQAAKPNQVKTHIAVNTIEQAKALKDFDVVYAIGDKIRGVTLPSYVLSSKLKAGPRDIVILASDDFFPPKNWDLWVTNQFKNFEGCLVVDDGYQYGKCITLPIMSFRCLERLNHIIYHPIYGHLWSDNELYYNVHAANLLRDLRQGPRKSPLFEHRHPDNGKRKRDNNDMLAYANSGGAKQLFGRRLKLPLRERLKINHKWRNIAQNIKKQ